MAKRGLNIYKRKDGRWEGRISLRNNVYADKRKYQSVYGHSYREVKEKMSLLVREKDFGKRRCPLTVKQVVELWLNEKRYSWKESTYASYRQIAEHHLYGDFGQMNAASLSSTIMGQYIHSIKKTDGSKIADSYANSIGSVILQAFAYATKEHQLKLPLLVYNRKKKTSEKYSLPSDKEMQCLTNYLYAHTDDSTCLGILLACYTGIRIGEVCALRWKDIDEKEEVLRIRENMQRIKSFNEEGRKTEVKMQAPKTINSVRTIPIPAPLMQILKKKRDEDECYLIRGKRKPWAETRTLQYRFARILESCEIEHFHFHMLRHYFATRCIRQGFDVKSLSEILGHANIQVTLNLYVHSTMQQKRILMNRLFEDEKF